MVRARPVRAGRSSPPVAAGCAGAAGLSPSVRPEQGFTPARHRGAPGRRRADNADHRASHRLGRRLVGAVFRRPDPCVHRPGRLCRGAGAAGSRHRPDRDPSGRSGLLAAADGRSPGATGTSRPQWVGGAQHLARATRERAPVGGRRRPGGRAGPRDGRHALHGVDGRVRRPGAPLHPVDGLPVRGPGAEPRGGNRGCHRVPRQHRGGPAAAAATPDVPRTAGPDPGRRGGRLRSFARRPGLAGA